MLRVRLGTLVLVVGSLVGCRGSSPAAPDPPTPRVDAPVAAIFLTPNTWQLPAAGGSVSLIVSTAATTAGNLVAAHVTVALEASAGTIDPAVVETDFTGHARATWTGSTNATVTARAGDVTGTSVIQIVVPPTLPDPVPPPVVPLPPPSGPDLRVGIVPRSGNLLTTETVAQYDGLAFDGLGRPVSGVTFRWDLNGDGVYERDGPSVSTTFPTPGAYVVRVHGSAPDGRQAAAELRVTVDAVLRVTLTTSSYIVNVGQAATLLVTTTGPPASNVSWDFESDGTVDEDGPSLSTTHAFATAGAYTVTATVRAADGQVVVATVVVLVE